MESDNEDIFRNNPEKASMDTVEIRELISRRLVVTVPENEKAKIGNDDKRMLQAGLDFMYISKLWTEGFLDELTDERIIQYHDELYLLRDKWKKAKTPDASAESLQKFSDEMMIIEVTNRGLTAQLKQEGAHLNEVPVEVTSQAEIDDYLKIIIHEPGNEFLQARLSKDKESLRGRFQIIKSNLRNTILSVEADVLQAPNIIKMNAKQQVEEIISDINERIGKRINLDTELEEEVESVEIVTDPRLMGRLVANICQNLINKFGLLKDVAEAPDVKVKASVTEMAGRNFVQLSISDNGEGYPPKIEELGFVEGLTVPVGKADEGHGTGMAGVSESIRQQLGGKVIPFNITDANGEVIRANLDVLLQIAE